MGNNKELIDGKSAIIQFEDFNFKLMVINHLMYEEESLKPKFDVDLFCEQNDIDIEASTEELEEALSFFHKLPIPSHLLNDITALSQKDNSPIFFSSMAICKR